jgi:chemotaxis protein methyltransferase WspC
MSQIEQWLRERIGLDAASIGSSLIQRAVRLRMKSLGLRQLAEYKLLLARGSVEWTELVEAVVVAETWFFRESEQFRALGELALKEWLPGHRTGQMRLLSLPCSSGEEPYSMVMALLEAGVPPGRFQVDAADISGRALARARAGGYGKNSFRGDDLGFRARYFERLKESYQLSPAVRSCVSFYQGNLLAESFLAGQHTYDFVFFRNLLIYFDRATQQRALSKLSRLLAPLGVLFVSPAENALAVEQGFVDAGIPMAFACRKSEHGVTRSGSSRHCSPTKESVGCTTEGRPLTPTLSPSGGEREKARPPWSSSASRRLGGNSAPAPLVSGTGASGANTSFLCGLKGQEAGQSAGAAQADLAELERARRLADGGQLKEAAALCEAHLSRHRDSAQAYYLLGLVREGARDLRAADCYRKALYLDPNHYESLVQMARLAEKSGDTTRAHTLKQRARRLKARGR